MMGGALISWGYNLVQAPGNCDFDGEKDITQAVPGAGVLSDNGGFTLTHSLAADSPAVDAGSCHRP